MSDKNAEAEVRRRMAKIREIADGIYDRDERRAVRKLVRDYEKLMLPKVP